MKKFLYLLTTTLLFLTAQAQQADYRTVPLPQSITLMGKAGFIVTEDTRIEYPAGNDEMQQNAEFLAEYLEKATGLRLETTTLHDKKAHNIILKLEEINPKSKKGQSGIADEGYLLRVSDTNVTLTGKDATGVFYGVQMLRKSLSYNGKMELIEFPAGTVQDEPRFGYRGMHLDCCRHFFDVDFVKEYIDLIALHQMNRFHWHLTDDQGWRVEIKKYPRLTEVGSWRKGTVIGCNSDVEDGQRYGGYYTQEQIREVVAYAHKRHVEVIPEIDMPGHMLAALTAYPELGCTGGPYEVGTRWGVYRDVLCAGNERAYTFIQEVLDEILPLFPSEYIHIGGDESPRNRWEACPKCQQKIKQEGFVANDKRSAEDMLQSYFTKRIESYINGKGKRVIGWDEVLKGEINPSTTIMAWRGMAGGIAAAKAGHDVIMTPLTHCYFDYVQDTLSNYEPQSASIMPIMVDKVYTLDVPAELTPDEQKHILGMQANLWTEYVQCNNWAEYMVLPRMAALSECQWLPVEQKDLADFKKRLLKLLKLYDAYGWNYGKQVIPDRKVDRWNL